MAEVNVRDEGFTVLSQGVEPVAESVIPPRSCIKIADLHLTALCSSTAFRATQRRHGHTARKRKSPQNLSTGWRSCSLERSSPKTRRGRAVAERHIFSGQRTFKDFPNVRVLTYGYDSQVSKFFKGPANQSGILAHGESLMHALEVQRRGCRQRPILFLVHSLGGIILKQVRIRSLIQSGKR